MLKRLFPVLAVVACSTGPPDEGAVDLLVRSDKPSYSLSVDHSAVPVLINRSGHPGRPPVGRTSPDSYAGTVIWTLVSGAVMTRRRAIQ